VVREYRTFSKHKLKPAEIKRLSETRPYKTLTYNREGDLLEEDNLWGLRYTYSYDAAGLRMKTANGDKSPGSGDPIAPYVAELIADKYDASGNKIETVSYIKYGATPWFRHTYEYDDKGRRRRMLYYGRDATSNLKLSRVVTYTYVVKGNEREACWRDAAGELVDRLTYTNYKLDRMGNWVERTEARYQIYDKHQPREQWGTIYRVITYY
jgi:YD repeat-containing protein